MWEKGEKIMQGKMYDIRQDLIKLETAVATYKRLNGMQDFEDEVIANALLFNTARGAFFGIGGTEKNRARAFALFCYLFEKKRLSVAAFYIGEEYKEGIVVDQDLNKAFDYYLIAAKMDADADGAAFSEEKEYAKAKIEMAKLLIGREIDLPGVDTSQYYWYGFGCYLCAADDGDKQAEMMLTSLSECHGYAETDDEEDSDGVPLYDFYHPDKLLHRARAGDAAAMFALAQLYLHEYSPYFRLKYTKKWLLAASRSGDRGSKYLLITVLIAEDNICYEENPNVYEVYYQDSTWKKLATRLIEPRHEEIVNEILVVSSKKRAEEIFRRMKSYLFEYMDAQAVDEILRVYFELVNASNSYIRIKPGLPSDDED